LNHVIKTLRTLLESQLCLQDLRWHHVWEVRSSQIL